MAASDANQRRAGSDGQADSSPGSARQGSPFQRYFPPEEFAARRAKVFEAIGDEAHALLQGAGPARGFEVSRQSNEFYYLCGVEVAQSYLLLNGESRTTTLLLPETDEGRVRSEGPMLGPEDPELVKELTGVEAVGEVAALPERLEDVRTLYVPHSAAEGRMMTRWAAQSAGRAIASDPWDGRLTREAQFIGRLQTRYPRLEIRDLCPILDELRVVKSPREIEMLRRAARLSGLAVMEAMRSTAPGVMEYQLGAVASYIFRVNGASGEGYRPIVAGGPNAWHGHYFRNDCVLTDGDLVLMDCAPEYGYYTSDIGRMWPVGGKYDAQQRELYGLVVEYHKALLPRIRPGVMATTIMEEAAEQMREVISGTTFSKPIYEQAALRMLEFGGHLSHSVGMAVHDVGGYRSRPLVPGLVFAVDPQMWIPEEKLYIRAEDTVVVTEDGIENLTGFVPLELDDVEALMQEPGMLQRFPPEGLSESLS